MRGREALAARRREGAGRGVARHHARQAEIHGAQAAEDAARRVGDVLRLEAGGRHLVEEGQEAVVVARVDPEGIDAGAPEPAHGAQPGEAGAEDDDGRGRGRSHPLALAGRPHLASRAVRTYTGGCHCGRVRYELTADLARVSECNCSICTRKAYLHLIVPRDRFRLFTGEAELATYRFGTMTARHLFCRYCGVASFYVPRSHPDRIDVNVRCLAAWTSPR